MANTTKAQEDTLESLRIERDVARRERDVNKNRFLDALNDVERLKARVIDAESEDPEYENEVSRLDLELKRMAVERDQACVERDDAFRDNSNLSHLLKRAEEELEKCNKELQGDTLERLRIERDIARDDLNTITAKSKAEIGDLRAEVDRLKDELRKSQAECRDRGQELYVLRRDDKNNVLSSRCKELEAINKNLKEMHSDTSSELSRVLEELEKSDEEIRTRRSQYMEMSDRIERLEKKLTKDAMIQLKSGNTPVWAPREKLTDISVQEAVDLLLVRTEILAGKVL